jgi:hypothetical protein
MLKKRVLQAEGTASVKWSRNSKEAREVEQSEHRREMSSWQVCWWVPIIGI